MQNSQSVTHDANGGRADIRQQILDALMRRNTFAIIIGLLAAVVWIPLLRRSFWIDEACTFWMAHEGVARAIQKTWHWPGQSPLYSAIASLFCFNGSSFRDALLRIPSLFGIAIATYFLYQLAEKRIARGAGVVATILFLFNPSLVSVGYQARPYGLAIAAVIASCWALCEWVETRSRIDLLWYVVASTFVIYLHYIFTFVFAVQGLYLAYVFLIDRRRSRWVEMACAGFLTILLAIPLVPHIKLMLNERHALSFQEVPHLFELTDFLLSSVLVAGLVIVGYLLPKLYPNLVGQQLKMPPSTLFFLMSWWLLIPFIFFAISRFTSTRPFVPRYLIFTLPAQALLLAYAGVCLFGFAGARLWAVLAVLLFAANPLVIISTGTAANTLLPVTQFIRSRPADPVFFPSLLYESQFYDWRAGNQPGSYLMAPLVAYPVRNPVFPLPGTPTYDVKDYISGIIDSQLGGAQEVMFVVSTDRWEDFVSDWVTERMHVAGFQVAIHKEGSFIVYVFTSESRADTHLRIGELGLETTRLSRRVSALQGADFQ
jgi:hypothetical protein